MSSEPNTGPRSNDGYTRMPNWVKWSLITALTLVVLAVFVVLVVGGDHGPGRHFSAPPRAHASHVAALGLTGR